VLFIYLFFFIAQTRGLSYNVVRKPAAKCSNIYIFSNTYVFKWKTIEFCMSCLPNITDDIEDVNIVFAFRKYKVGTFIVCVVLLSPRATLCAPHELFVFGSRDKHY